MSKRICGIDLGTGNSCVSVIENGKPIVVANKEGRRTTPSVVFIKGDERKVGDSAKRGMVMNPKNTVNCIKRFMGVSYDDKDAQKMMKTASYKIVNKNNKPYVDIDGKTYSPEEISSFILSEMKKTAEDYVGGEIKDAVITCPAFYDNNQRESVKLAGELAGLNVLRVINEPTAAIMSSNIDLNGKDSKIVAVVDSGQGTLDVSICEISDGMIEVLSSYGNCFLGGSDFDNRIVDWIADEFMKDHSGVDLRKDQMALARLVEAAEKAKIELSGVTETEINLPYITVIDSVPQMFVKTISRAIFDNITKDLIDEHIKCALEAIKKAKKTVNDIDEVLLVGGSCRIPALQDALSKSIGKPLNKGTNLDEAVSLGACIQANTLSNPNESENSVLLLDVTPISLGIETMGGVMTKLIDANTTIPTTKSQIFSTAVDNQSAVTINVLQGERPMSADNKQIGLFNLEGIAPAKRGIPQIEVSFDIDANGILSVKAVDKATGKEQKITINNSNSLSKDEVDRIKAEAEAHKEEDIKKEEEIKEFNNIEGFKFGIENVIKDENFKDKISEDDKTKINDLVSKLNENLNKRDLEASKKSKEELESVWNPIVTKLYQEGQKTEQSQKSQTSSEEDIKDADFEEVK